VCRCLAEDYAHWSGGFPDLILWNAAARQCKVRPPGTGSASVGATNRPKRQFVEVKGPGDRLSDTQRVWLSTLAALGADVALCHVQGVCAQQNLG
jgi:fanconi-associated nuclease 1